MDASEAKLLSPEPSRPMTPIAPASTQSTFSACCAALARCCSFTKTVTVGGRQYAVLRQVGEGGYSYVYLVEDKVSRAPMAMKKIRCATPEALRQTRWEVQVHQVTIAWRCHPFGCRVAKVFSRTLQSDLVSVRGVCCTGVSAPESAWS